MLPDERKYMTTQEPSNREGKHDLRIIAGMSCSAQLESECGVQKIMDYRACCQIERGVPIEILSSALPEFLDLVNPATGGAFWGTDRNTP